jgi:hypothetical protein
MGDLNRAMVLYQQRLAIARELQDRQGEGNALWGISLVSDKTGNRASAIEHVKSTLKIFEEIQSPSLTEIRKLLVEWGIEESIQTR